MKSRGGSTDKGKDCEAGRLGRQFSLAFLISKLAKDSSASEIAGSRCIHLQARHCPAANENVKYIKEIAHGGFGVVALVEDVTGTTFAQKTFSPPLGLDPLFVEKARKRFAREVRLQEALSHPNILPIISSDLSVDPPTFLMPLADETYAEQVARDRLDGTVTLEPLLDILAGLEELHRIGCVHRDLKPPNVLKVGASWMLSDFGLAMPPERETAKVTSTKEFWGTELYMPPEQRLDFRSAAPTVDIYAFGCMLHDVAGGTPRLPHVQHSCTGALGSIIERCTAPDPDDRFQTVAGLRNALLSALSSSMAVATTPQGIHWVERLRTDADNMTREEWRDLITYLDKHQNEPDALAVRQAIDIPQLDAAFAGAPHLFLRLSDLLCDWIQKGGFEWSYCDVLVSRLLHIYEMGDVAAQALATLAALEMGFRHNRWHVMRTFLRMADGGISEDLADRLVVEFFALDGEAVLFTEHLAKTLNTSLKLHPKLMDALAEITAAAKSRRLSLKP